MTENTMTCSSCGRQPKSIRLRKSDGKPALPMKWQLQEDGSLLCSECRNDDPVVNWTYGADIPIEGLSAIIQQFRFAHQFRNKLCEIELQRREKTDAAIRAHSPELADLEIKIEQQSEKAAELAAEIKARNADQRKRTHTAEDRAKLAELRRELSASRSRRKELRSQIFAGNARDHLLSPIDTSANAAIKLAYNDSPLYWGTKGIVNQAAKSMRKGSPPKFLPWTGGKRIADDDVTADIPRIGHIAVQLQGGQTIAQTLEASNVFRIEMTGVKTRGGEIAIARFRVGSNPNGSPIMARIPICVHRMPPLSANVKWAHLLFEMVGDVPRWKIMLALQWPEAHDRPDAANHGKVGINLGWRHLPDGSLRIASWAGDDGNFGQLVLPLKQVQALDYLDNLKSIQDTLFNESRQRLIDWLESHAQPDWLFQATESLAQWRSARRLCRLVLYWKDHRFDGDNEIFDRMNGIKIPHKIVNGKQKYRYFGFRLQWKHINDMEEGRRARLRAQRDNMYRSLAAQLSRQYETVCMDNTDYRILRLRPKAAEEDKQSVYLRRIASLASVGRLRSFIAGVMRNIVSIDSHYITQRCHSCGNLQSFNASEHVVNCCRHCKNECDQDENAARNALALGINPTIKYNTARNPEPDDSSCVMAND